MIPKYLDHPCPHCGTPRTVINGLWLRERRKRAGFSLRDFAARVDCSPAYICDIEHNRRNCLPKMKDAYENLASFELGAVPP